MNEHVEFLACVAIFVFMGGGMCVMVLGAIGLLEGSVYYIILAGRFALVIIGWMLGKIMGSRTKEDDGPAAG